MLSTEQIQDNWNLLLSSVSPAAKALLEFYEDSVARTETSRILGMKEAPAGKGVHHDYLGGLVQHILEGFEYLDTLHAQFPETAYSAMRDAFLLHDLHKGFYHYLYTVDDGKTQGTISYLDHALTKMYTPNQKTMFMISGSVPGCPVLPISLKVHHIINCSEGGWAENPPKESSVEAKLCYLADELSVIKNRCAQGKLDSIYKRDADWSTVVPPSPKV